MKDYISGRLQKTPPISCDFKVGDQVTYTNDYGVSFENEIVIGFSKPTSNMLKYGAFIHLGNSSYWMPLKPQSLCFGPAQKINKDLILNNGQKASHMGFDFWCRPLYELESGAPVCCVNLDGTFLHTISKDGEPISPLKFGYQATV